MIDVETLAYAAGLLDAEGSIGISVRKPSSKNLIKNPSHELYMSLKVTNQPVIEWLKSKFDGFTNDHSHMPSRIGYTPIWLWRVTGPTAQKFLKLVYPYLRTKQQQAALAIDFQAYQQKYPATVRANRTQEINDRREAYRQQLHSLHLFRQTWISDKSFSMLSPIEAMPITNSNTINAYAAGFFDGEGCIFIQAAKPTGQHGNGKITRPSYCLRAQIANTDQGVLNWFQATFGGCLQDRSSTPSAIINPKNRPYWLWYISSANAQDFLKDLEPYLQIKQPQAKLTIEFQNYNQPHVFKKPEDLARKEDFRQQISKLNLSQKPLKSVI